MKNRREDKKLDATDLSRLCAFGINKIRREIMQKSKLRYLGFIGFAGFLGFIGVFTENYGLLGLFGLFSFFYWFFHKEK